SAGAYADKIAQKFGLAQDYTMLPFKGIYLKYINDKIAIKTNIYPVPNLSNPFLGIHYTITADGSIKIGPTAIPAFWRENYKGFDNFNFNEMVEILYYETKLFLFNSFNFRNLAVSEMKNYIKSIFIKKAKSMVYEIGDDFQPIPAGIRSQLLNKTTNELVQDFVVEHGDNSTHILNAVSPAFTCSFAFAKYIVEEINQNKAKYYE
ncbi:MAG TPA: FAD-dependent oxidoreductase, partial [Arcobacter sp.]|nr:FAD-dependent oxidoreductase [Arcobacter sp.]